MNQYEDLLGDLDIPNWKARTTKPKSPRRTQVQPRFEDTEPLRETSVTQPTMWSRTLSRLKLVVAIIMVTSSLLGVLVMYLIWPALYRSTEFVMQCNPPYVTTNCPHIEYSPNGKR